GALVTCLGMVSRQLFGFYSSGFVLMFCVLLRVPAKALKEMTGKTWIEINREYEALKKLSKLVNLAVSNVVLLYLLQAMFYNSIDLNGIFVSETLLQTVRAGIFILMCMLILYWAGDTCEMVKSVLEVEEECTATCTITNEAEQKMRRIVTMLEVNSN